MQVKAIDYFNYAVENLDKGIAFYRDVLGLKLDSSGEGWAEFDIGGKALVLGSYNFDKSKAGNANGMALAVDDIGNAVKELKGKGVKVLDESWETPVCFGATIEDPFGNKIYLHNRKDGTAG